MEEINSGLEIIASAGKKDLEFHILTFLHPPTA
jgi:hypothetical protein